MCMHTHVHILCRDQYHYFVTLLYYLLLCVDEIYTIYIYHAVFQMTWHVPYTHVCSTLKHTVVLFCKFRFFNGIPPENMDMLC